MVKFSKLGFGVLDGMNDNKFQLAEIERIRALISPCLRRTPLLDSFCNQGLFLKAENRATIRRCVNSIGGEYPSGLI